MAEKEILDNSPLHKKDRLSVKQNPFPETEKPPLQETVGF